MKRFNSSEIQYKISVFIVNYKGFDTYNGVIYPGLIGKHCRKETTKKLKSIPKIFDELYSMVNSEYSVVSLDEIIHLEITNNGFTISLDESDCGTTSGDLSKAFNDGLRISSNSIQPGDFRFVNSCGKLRNITPVVLHHPDIDLVTNGKGVKVPIDSECITYLVRVGAITTTRSNIPIKLIVELGRVPDYRVSIPAISGFFKGPLIDSEFSDVEDIARKEYERRRTNKYVPGKVYHQYRDNQCWNCGYRDLLYIGTFRNIITRSDKEGNRSVAYFKPDSIFDQGDLEVSDLVHTFLDVTNYYEDYVTYRNILEGILGYFTYNPDIYKNNLEDLYPVLYKEVDRPSLIPSDRTIDLPTGDIESKVVDMAWDSMSCWGNTSFDLHYDPYDEGYNSKCLVDLGFQYLPLVYSKLTKEQRDTAIEILSFFKSDQIVNSILLVPIECVNKVKGIDDYVKLLQ